MTDQRSALMAYIDQLGIETTTKTHPPIFTVEDGEEHWADIPGVHCKNLFLCDAKKAMWLVVCPTERVIDLKSLPDKIGSKRLSFGSADRLRRVLAVEPGSVTPFALFNDRLDHAVTVILDQWMMDQPLLNFHPLENTATTTISNQGLKAFIESCGHTHKIVDLRTA